MSTFSEKQRFGHYSKATQRKRAAAQKKAREAFQKKFWKAYDAEESAKVKKNPSRPPKRTPAYVRRPSEVTRKKPSPRLKKRRAKNVKKAYFPNPSAFGVYARGSDKKMHLTTDAKFSSNGKARRFKSSDEAAKAAYTLVEKFPVLSKYRITVESIGRAPPGK